MPRTWSLFFNKTYKELTPIHLKLFQEIEEEETLLDSFYKASITLVPKPDKNTTWKEDYRPVSLMNIVAKSFTNPSRQIQHHIKKTIYHDQSGFIPGIQGWFDTCKSRNVMYHINRVNDKIICHLTNAEKNIYKIQYAFIFKILNKLEYASL